MGTTWTYLEDHLQEPRERIDNLLSDTLRAGEPVGPEELYLYYKKVCQFLDTEEGESNINNLITMDQLDMLLCTLPSEETFQVGAMGWREASRGYTLHVLRLLLAARSRPESTGQVVERGRGRSPSHGLALRLPKMVGTLRTGGYLWKLPHAGGVPNVRGHDTGREAVSDPEEKAVPVLPSTPGHKAVPLTLPTGLPHQRMHEDASQNAAQGSATRGGQTCRARDGTRRRRPPP